MTTINFPNCNSFYLDLFHQIVANEWCFFLYMQDSVFSRENFFFLRVSISRVCKCIQRWDDVFPNELECLLSGQLYNALANKMGHCYTTNHIAILNSSHSGDFALFMWARWWSGKMIARKKGKREIGKLVLRRL